MRKITATGICCPPVSLAQRGGASLLMVLVLIVTGSLMLEASSQLISQEAQQSVDTQYYYQTFSQALSSLQWASVQHWPVQQGWVCLSSATESLYGCLRRISSRDGVLRATSAQEQWVLWQRVAINPADPQHIRLLPNGWSDRCPFSSGWCQPQPGSIQSDRSSAGDYPPVNRQPDAGRMADAADL